MNHYIINLWLIGFKQQILQKYKILIYIHNNFSLSVKLAKHYPHIYIFSFHNYLLAKLHVHARVVVTSQHSRRNDIHFLGKWQKIHKLPICLLPTLTSSNLFSESIRRLHQLTPYNLLEHDCWITTTSSDNLYLRLEQFKNEDVHVIDGYKRNEITRR